MLRKAGFGDDYESGMVVRTFKGKAFWLCAGAAGLSSAFVLAAHGDTPRVDFKQHPFMRTLRWARRKLTITAASASTSGFPARLPRMGYRI